MQAAAEGGAGGRWRLCGHSVQRGTPCSSGSTRVRFGRACECSALHRWAEGGGCVLHGRPVLCSTSPPLPMGIHFMQFPSSSPAVHEKNHLRVGGSNLSPFSVPLRRRKREESWPPLTSACSGRHRSPATEAVRRSDPRSSLLPDLQIAGNAPLPCRTSFGQLQYASPVVAVHPTGTFSTHHPPPALSSSSPVSSCHWRGFFF